MLRLGVQRLACRPSLQLAAPVLPAAAVAPAVPVGVTCCGLFGLALRSDAAESSNSSRRAGSQGSKSGQGTKSRRHTESCVLPYTPSQVYSVVADVASYPDFLPWVVGASVRSREGTVMTADLKIGFPPLTERYTSRVQLAPGRAIKVVVPPGALFDHLHTLWRFEPVRGRDGSATAACRMMLSIDFQFQKSLYQAVSDMFFDQVLLNLRHAFVQRIHRVCEAEKASLRRV